MDEQQTTALGRWTIQACERHDEPYVDEVCSCINDHGERRVREFPVVPCDDAAVERAARAIDDAAMGALDGIRNENPERLVDWARAALRAAGEEA